jgi:hypothetical protein
MAIFSVFSPLKYATQNSRTWTQFLAYITLNMTLYVERNHITSLRGLIRKWPTPVALVRLCAWTLRRTLGYSDTRVGEGKLELRYCSVPTVFLCSVLG